MNTTVINVGARDVDLYDIPEGITLPDLSDKDWFDTSDQSYECGTYGVEEWDLGGGMYLRIDTDQGVPIGGSLDDYNIYEHISQWEHDGCELAEWYAGWGLDGLGALDDDIDGYNGPCRVWHKPQYYQGTYNAPTPGFARDDNDEIREFASVEEAKEYVEEYYTRPSGYDGIPECHVLSHGQAGPDVLTIVRA